MKLHFEPKLDYQLDAIEAVCDLFHGQEICRTEFTVTKNALDNQFFSDTNNSHHLGIGNRLTLLDDEILKNLNDVQLRNGLSPSETLTSGDFTVEMETGTGKTYVYLRTILELNKRYGFTKYIVIVPSVAIKEGVYKSLQIMEEHFKGLYAGTPFDYFFYDSSKLGQVRNFATSSQIQIMVVTVGAINKKDVNNLYKDSEKTGGEKPIDLIKATRPILIVDEPQSVDGGLSGAGKIALDAMHPLCTLRYSATHVDKHHMVYRLDAVDAYEHKLVKQIEVASAMVKDAHNKPFIRLISTSNKQGVINAKVELDIEAASGVKRREITVLDGDDLEQTTKRMIYHNCRIGEIRVGKGKEFLELRVPGGEHYLKPGETFGDVDALSVQREMIRRTIKEHLDKEKRLRPQGIKVLSLFFIDAVDRYRQYDENGNQIKGVYAHIFEEEYRRWAKHPDYNALFQEVDLESAAKEVHDGYFSIDKKGSWTDTTETNQSNRDNAERAYNLIMKEKEKLLSFKTPLKFIFSHSALREGWDNPNIFQICTLRDIQTNRERRQTIGRGLRLCVNQVGERVRGFEVNTLTVIATESYEEFAENLQKEIENDTGIRFGIIEPHQFARIPVLGPNGQTVPLGFEQSQSLWENLMAQGYIDLKGRVQDSLKKVLKDNTLSVPESFRAQLTQINQVLRKQTGRLEIKNADERRQLRLRKEILHSPEFKALWDRIKHKTTYRVQFDNEMLIENCIQALQEAPKIPKTRLQWRKANIAIGKASVDAIEQEGAEVVMLNEADIELPDLLTNLQDRTQLTRLSIHRILSGSHRLHDFKCNPQQFIELASEAINRRKRLALVDGIRYHRLGDENYYAQELFEEEELSGYLKNMLSSKKSVYEQVAYDSAGTERPFAEQLENNSAVKVYAKLPGWFKVPTPLGTYNPDWAVLIEKNGAERIYFVVETKSSLFSDDLRDKEKAKIACAKMHFSALSVSESPAKYIVARSVDEIPMEEIHYIYTDTNFYRKLVRESNENYWNASYDSMIKQLPSLNNGLYRQIFTSFSFLEAVGDGRIRTKYTPKLDLKKFLVKESNQTSFDNDDVENNEEYHSLGKVIDNATIAAVNHFKNHPELSKEKLLEKIDEQLNFSKSLAGAELINNTLIRYRESIIQDYDACLDKFSFDLAWDSICSFDFLELNKKSNKNDKLFRKKFIKIKEMLLHVFHDAHIKGRDLNSFRLCEAIQRERLTSNEFIQKIESENGNKKYKISIPGMLKEELDLCDVDVIHYATLGYFDHEFKQSYPVKVFTCDDKKVIKTRILLQLSILNFLCNDVIGSKIKLIPGEIYFVDSTTGQINSEPLRVADIKKSETFEIILDELPLESESYVEFITAMPLLQKAP